MAVPLRLLSVLCSVLVLRARAGEGTSTDAGYLTVAGANTLYVNVYADTSLRCA